MLKAIVERVALFFVPIALGYLWRLATEPRDGKLSRPAAPAPAREPDRLWLWLIAAGALLVAASLVTGPLLPHPADRSRYVPGEVQPGGAVSQGHFEPAGNAAS